MDCVGMDTVCFLTPREDQSILLSEKNKPDNIYTLYFNFFIRNNFYVWKFTYVHIHVSRVINLVGILVK